MQQKKPTIHEIAEALGTTASTVSRALNDHPRISEKTKKAVVQMANKMGYEPNAMASALRSGKSKLIGIVVPYADRIFFSSIIRGIEEEVKKYGFNVIICQSYERYENEVEDIKVLLNAQVAGIIISVSKETKDYTHLQRVLDKGKPLIMFDRTIELDACSVVIDDFKGANEAVSHLIDQGYRRIAFFSGQKTVSIFKERFRGYQNALIERGLSFHEEYVIEISSDPLSGAMAIEKLMDLPVKPDALFSASDHSALGAIKWLKEHGFNVPLDFGVIGFSNEPFTQYFEPSISSVDQKSREMGEMTAKIFIEQYQSETNLPRKIVLKPELLIRESSKRIKTLIAT